SEEAMSKKWVEIEQILTDLLGDLAMAVTVLKDYESKPFLQEPQNFVKKQCIWRLCTFSLVINCCKYVELNTKYGNELNKLIPEHNKVRGKFNEAVKKNKAINKLRNHCVAHVSDRAVHLSPTEVQKEIIEMFGGQHADDFLNWICPDDIESTNKSESLVGVIELLRDAVSSKL
ncbi:hypothetical protein, partial [Vibrio alginolyticus]|uniref:hypothetical protein n=4 Tax=Vibrionaceae TaxID=641 RepID=UPI00215BCDF9